MLEDTIKGTYYIKKYYGKGFYQLENKNGKVLVRKGKVRRHMKMFWSWISQGGIFSGWINQVKMEVINRNRNAVRLRNGKVYKRCRQKAKPLSLGGK